MKLCIYTILASRRFWGGKEEPELKKSGWCVRLYICRPVFIEKLKLSVKRLVVSEHRPIITWAQFQFTEHTFNKKKCVIPIDVISYILYIENKEGSSGHALSDLWAPLSDMWPPLGDMCATLIDLRAPLRNNYGTTYRHVGTT